MNILLCNNTLSLMAGSETAVYSMALQLKNKGHQVTAVSFNLGTVSDKLKKAGVECVDTLYGRRKDFDIAICNHIDPTNYVKANCPDIPIISTIHGIIGGPETPPLYADAFVAVSEEVRDLLKKKYGVESQIIRNSVDMKRFKEEKPREKKIKTLLFSSSYVEQDSDIFKALHTACRIMNIEMHAAGRGFNWIWEMEEVYNAMDIVVTLGRGCLEAMSCNRPALVLGHWGTNQEISSDGMITSENIEEIRKNNFSSRRYRMDWGVREIVDELSKYDCTTNYRELVKHDHNIKNSVDAYLKIAEKLI